MEALFDSSNNSVWNVKQPEADWKEHQLDKVSYEKVVVGQKLLSEELRPCLELLLFDFPEKSLDCSETSQVQKEHIDEHKDKIPNQKGFLALRFGPPIFHQDHHIEQKGNQDNRDNHGWKWSHVLVYSLLRDKLIL